MRLDGIMCTLRTENELIWLYQIDDAGNQILSRCLHPVERLALQGFPVELANPLSKTDRLRATGNSCSVAVVTSAFRHWLSVATKTRV